MLSYIKIKTIVFVSSRRGAFNEYRQFIILQRIDKISLTYHRILSASLFHQNIPLIVCALLHVQYIYMCTRFVGIKGMLLVFETVTRLDRASFWVSVHPSTTEAYKGHCVLCKDVLSFVYQTFDFQVLCFGFCFLCPVLLNGAMET